MSQENVELVRSTYAAPSSQPSCRRLNSFVTIAGDSASPWILHVPHSSTGIPGPVRERILLDDDALDAELRAMTDAHTCVATPTSAVTAPRTTRRSTDSQPRQPG